MTTNQKHTTEELPLGIAIIVVMLDDMQHSLPERPFCGDPMCPCHEDPQLNQEYFMQPYMDGLMTREEAVQLWYGRQV